MGERKMMFIEKLRSQMGLALDEAVLVMTMLSGFAGFVVVANPLGVFGGGMNPTELASELQRIEQANYEFHSRYLSWPHETTNGSWKDNITVLQTAKAMKAHHRDRTYIAANFLPEYEMSRKTSALQHEWGKGGDISQHEIEHNGQKYLEVILENVPYETARKVDIEVDGTYEPNEGRIQIYFEDDKINLRYRANRIL
jgi:hypothetical protein